MGNHAADIDRHIRVYLLVFAILAVLTVVTVGVYYLHLPLRAAVGLALVIASIKASLVACYFMHLISEKRMIFFVLTITIVFFAALLMLPVLTSVAGRVGG